MKRLILISVMGLLLNLAMLGGAGGSEAACSDLGNEKFNLSCSNFPGFYYDLDQNICTERMFLMLSDISSDKSRAMLSDQENENGMRGVVYMSKAKEKNFRFKPWGAYYVLGFMGNPCFVSYSNKITKGMEDAGETVPPLAVKSGNVNLMVSEETGNILIDDDTERTITSDSPLILGEGYELNLRSIDENNGKVYVELTKDGAAVDSKVVYPTKPGATMQDRTYCYKRQVGDAKEIVTIAVHFKNAAYGADTNIAIIDGVFQVSDVATPLKVDQQYEKMSVKQIDSAAMTVIMDNKDNQITLSKNKDRVLMGDIYIRTANQDIIDADTPLRYCIYKKSY